MNKQFPNDMIPLGESSFTFACHSDVPCFTRCCKNVNLTLYPYDVLCLKNFLKMDSEEFLRTHIYLVKEDNPFFPTVKLQLLDITPPVCPFLDETGCKVYKSRPSACRTYPLERAVDRVQDRFRTKEFYFLTDHSYCKGHFETKANTVKSWCREQQLYQFNIMNDLWAELDTLFTSNPWKGEGPGGERQQLAFMACYNIDGFRRFIQTHKLLKKFRLSSMERRRILHDDTEMLKFAFEWLKFFLTGKSTTLVPQ